MSQFLALSHLQAVETPTKKYTYILLNTEAMPLSLGILSPASHGLSWFQNFFERDSYPDFFSLELVTFHQFK